MTVPSGLAGASITRVVPLVGIFTVISTRPSETV